MGRHDHNRASILDTMLGAFVLDRIDCLPYDQIADDIAKHFPKSRRIGLNTIHH